MTKKVIHAGNSLAITIPSVFVKSEGVKAGDDVEVVLNRETKSITYKFFGDTQLTLSPQLTKKS